MFDQRFQTIMNIHLSKYKVLKEDGQYFLALGELEKLISLLSQAIVPIFGKANSNLPTSIKPKLLEGKKEITLEEVINPDNIIMIGKEGILRIKK